MLCIVIGCQDMNTAANRKHADRIRALDNLWKEAAARRDLEGMMAIYADDAQELLPDLPPIVGHDSIRAFYRRLIEELPRFKHDFEPQEITVATSGDLAIVHGTYRFTADTLYPSHVQGGQFVGVWVNRNQDWRLKINISNSDSSTNP